MVKKIIITLVATLVVLFSAKFGYDYYQDNVSKMSKIVIDEIETVEEMDLLLSNNEVVYVYVGRPNCGDSDMFEKYFIDMMEENDIDNLYFFNIKSITDSYEDSQEYKDLLKGEFGVMYTPTLAKYENGALVLKSEWTPEGGYNKDMAEKFIKESGILND